MKTCSRKNIRLQHAQPAFLWLLVRITFFVASVPILMRLSMPALNRFLERRIAASVTAGAPSIEPDEIVRCVELILKLGSRLIRNRCLVRGVTLYYFLCRAGVPLTLCFGARCKDGKLTEEVGHCWLEKDGKPFLEKGNPYEYSVRIYTLPLHPRVATDNTLTVAA